jgi:hypothetical protein
MPNSLRFALLCLLLLLPACGSGPRKVPVSGTVSFDGKPVADGDIIFEDVDPKLGPDAGKIKDGKFAFTAKAGQKKVKIQASRLEKLPEGKKGAMGETEMPVDYIPEHYNSKTELKEEVKSSGTNTFTFDLKP